jgi:hypothetical protein
MPPYLLALHNVQFAVAAYANIDGNGRPTFSLYLNIPKEWIDPFVESWSQSQQALSPKMSLIAQDHLCNLLRYVFWSHLATAGSGETGGKLVERRK